MRAVISFCKVNYFMLGSNSNLLSFCALFEFTGGTADKESTCNVGDLGSIPGLGRSPGEEKGYPLQHSDLEKSMDCIVLGVPKSRTWLSNFHFQTLSCRHWPMSFLSIVFHGFVVLRCFSRVRLFATPRTVVARLLCPWNSPGKNTGVGLYFLLQGILPSYNTADSLPLSHKRSLIVNSEKKNFLEYSILVTYFSSLGEWQIKKIKEKYTF